MAFTPELKSSRLSTSTDLAQAQITTSEACNPQSSFMSSWNMCPLLLVGPWWSSISAWSKGRNPPPSLPASNWESDAFPWFVCCKVPLLTCQAIAEWKAASFYRTWPPGLCNWDQTRFAWSFVCALQNLWRLPLEYPSWLGASGQWEPSASGGDEKLVPGGRLWVIRLQWTNNLLTLGW